nr:GNAT family N-acetyltransferase [Candidatus Sigynarchaeota archaeon]
MDQGPVGPRKPVVIRDAVMQDASGIARVHVDSWKSTYAGIVPDGYLRALSHESGTEKVKAWFEHPFPGAKIFVAEVEAEGIVGFATGGLAREHHHGLDGELFAIYILAGHHRAGIGRSLVSRVAGHLKASGLAGMVTWVLASNPSRGFYERLGGKRAGERTIEIGKRRLDEISYGWSDLAPLLK